MQTRRVLRTARPIVSVKENENATTARTSRLAARGKTLASGTTSNAAPTTNATGAAGMRRTTFASRAKAQNLESAAASSKAADLDKHAPPKRKREALGEVAGGNKAPLRTMKGKEKEASTAVKKEYEGVVMKTKPASSRQPLRTVASKQITRKDAGEAGASKPKLEKPVKEEVKETKVKPARDENEHAMAIDHPTADRMPSLTVRRSLVASHQEHKVVLPKTATRGHRVRREIIEKIEEEEEEVRVFKKRRTSSDAPEPEAEEEEDPEAALHARLDAEMEAFANEEEHDPETSGWDDLDAEDGDDPLMVSEYVVEIFQYMKQLELSTMPNPNYMESQKELAWKMRGILTDWLVQVHVRFRLLPETLFLTINIIDRFLSARVVSLAKLQLVGVTCLFIAAKTEEIVAPGVGHFLAVADASYTESEILQAERYVLKTLDWNLSYPNPVHFLRRVSKADDYNVTVRTLGKYLLEIGCLEWRLIAAPPSLMAAAAIWLARLANGYEEWVRGISRRCYMSLCS